jgi:flagellar biosynthesis/type III secretory pathway protein FliH
MNTSEPEHEQDPDMADQLLGKADALIRRNRVDGVSSGSEELPLLTEIIDPPPQAFRGEPDVDIAPLAEARHTVVIGLSQDQAAVMVKQAVDRCRQELLQQQEQMVQESIERARQDLIASQSAMLQAAIARGRALGFAEGQTQGRNEALAEAEAQGQVAPALQIENARRETRQAVSLHFSERLIELDAYITQAIDGWLTRELPHLVTSEFEAIAERLRTNTAAHMRATLLPEISNKLSALLDSKPQ